MPFEVAKTWCWRPSWPSEGQNGPLIMSKLRGYFPLFFRKTNNPLSSQGELVEKGGMALSQNTLKKIKISPRIYLFPSKDVNAMLKLLVTTANGKPQTATSHLPFAVNAMLKVPIHSCHTAAILPRETKRALFYQASQWKPWGWGLAWWNKAFLVPRGNMAALWQGRIALTTETQSLCWVPFAFILHTSRLTHISTVQ